MNNYFSHCRSLSFLGYIHSNFSVNLRIILGDRRKCKWVFFLNTVYVAPWAVLTHMSVKYRQDFAVNSLITTDEKNSAFEAKRKRRQTSEHAMVRKREWERLVLIFSHSGKVKRSNAVCKNASYLNWSRVCRCSWFLFSLFLGRALGSSRIQQDTLVHTPTPSMSQELPPLLPPRWTPSFVGLCWLRSSSSLLVDLVLSCILVPASTMLAAVCAGGPYEKHVQASEVVFLSACCQWFVVQFWFWPLHLLSCLFTRCPVCSSAICDGHQSFC